jgi:hypothetical protein
MKNETKTTENPETPKTSEDKILDRNNLIAVVLATNDAIFYLGEEWNDYENDCLVSTMTNAFRAARKLDRAVQTYNYPNRRGYEKDDYAKHHPAITRHYEEVIK